MSSYNSFINGNARIDIVNQAGESRGAVGFGGQRLAVGGSTLKLKGNLLRGLLEWLWKRPFLLILLAHTIFSIGIWNARDGYAEDTTSVQSAFQVLQSHRPSSSIYSDLIALTLRCITPDPLAALTFIKYLSSLLATVALFLALNSFSGRVRQSAIVFACLVWIASSLDAPFLQSTSLSLFTFAIMLAGVDCLLLSESARGLFGFYFFGILAALLRPEYYLPVGLMTLSLAGLAVWSASRILESRFGWSRYWTRGGAICIALAGGMAFWTYQPARNFKLVERFDKYALLGLAQCYADFYHREHPEVAFSPMTEYRDLLNRKFDKPAGFCAAVRNNPVEALRYFTLNSARNLAWNVPGALLDRYREQSARYHHGLLYWIVRAIIFSGAFLGARRLYRTGWHFSDFSLRNSLWRKLFLLLLLLFTSVVAIVLLVGTSRYYLCWVPLFYLGVAYCADSLIRAFDLIRYEPHLVALSLILLGAPNYLTPRPNYEYDAVRYVAAHVKEHPVIAASWAEPDAILALCGNATAISLWDGIHQADVENGKIDILLIDQGFRESKTWADQRDFFQRFERQPDTFGFKEATGIRTGRSEVYYKVNPSELSPPRHN